jgi:hypothetical protein
MKNNKKDKILTFLDEITESIGRSDGESLDEVINELIEDGFDVDASVNRLKEKIKLFSLESKRQQLSIAREKRLSLDSEIRGKFGNFIGFSKDKLIGKINEFCNSSNFATSVSYRDLEQKSEEDLLALLEDLEMAKIMENEEK